MLFLQQLSQLAFAQQIPPMYFGQNYWFTSHSQVTGSGFAPTLSQWSEVKLSGAKLIRVGGANYNNLTTLTGDSKPRDPSGNPFYAGYVNIIDDIRNNGGEPMITIPFNHFLPLGPQEVAASEIMRVMNVVHKRNVKYIIIANEPDAGPPKGYGYNSGSPGVAAGQIAAYFKKLVIAVRKVDPNVTIIGPELAGWNGQIVGDLLSDPTVNAFSIKGQITAADDPTGITVGQNYLDVFTFHVYPFPVFTNATDISNFPANVSFGDFEFFLTNTQQKINNSPARPDMKIAVTEFNISSQVQPADANISGASVTAANGNQDSFIAGQWMAEMMAIGMNYVEPAGVDNNVAYMNFWSVKEGDDLGYIHNTSLEKKSTYWHFRLMADHFKGIFHRTKTTSLPAHVKAFASKNANSIAVMLINEHPTNDQTFTINTNASSGTGTNFVFSTGTPGSFSSASNELKAKSTMFLIFNCATGLVTDKFVLSETDMFNAYNPAGTGVWNPTHTIIGTTPAQLNASSTPACLIGGPGGSISASGISGTYNWVGPNGVTYTGASITGLTTPGVYVVSGTGSCGTTVQSATVLHLKSPLIDAGADQTFCPSGTTSFALGNSQNALPIISPGYSWSSGSTACGVPSGASTASGTNDYVTGASCNTSSQYILTANDGCTLTDETYVYISNASSGDLYIRDWYDDIGTEPNAETNASVGPAFWQSPDIWLRQVNDGIVNQTKQAIEYAPSVNNYVYVRVKNRGCTAMNGNVHIYWAKASTGLSWQTPNMWNNYNTTMSGCSATIYGDEITSSTGITVSIPPGGEQIVQVPWQAVNPNDYSCFPGSDKHHFCLLARIEHSPTYPHGMTNNEGNDIWINTKDNNNIAWTNIWIDNAFPPFIVVEPFGGTIIRNVVKETRFIKLNFASLKDEVNQALTDNTRIRLHFSHDFLKRWAEGGKRGKDVVMINDSTIELTSANAWMENIFLPFEKDAAAVALSLQSFKNPLPSSSENFTFQIIQYSQGTSVSTPQGGQTFLLKKQFYGKKCATATTLLSGVVLGVQTFTGSIQVTGNVIVPAGAQLIIQKAKVYVDENVKIKVLPGGIIKIIDSELYSTCTDKKWNGIEVKGNPLLPNPLVVQGSFITGTDNPLTVDKAKGIIISASSFVNDGFGTAIYLDKMKDFDISGNTFDGYNMGINTKKTYIADVKSIIAKNVFNHVKTAINFSEDNHTKLDIVCNQFAYEDYAINSDQTSLKDQGAVTEGAGNKFTTTSILPNNKIKHMNGNNPKYYYDPANPIASGMNVTVLASNLDPVCYTYSFDTSEVSASRLAQYKNIEALSQKGTIDVLPVPNPNAGQASIFFNLGEEREGEVIVMDIYGKILDRVKVTSASQKVDVNYTEYANGVYLVTLITSKGEAVNRKMIISK